jgi:hypothetical protein
MPDSESVLGILLTLGIFAVENVGRRAKGGVSVSTRFVAYAC